MSDLVVTSPQRPYTFPDKFKSVSNGNVYAGLVDKTDLENPANQIQVYVVNEDGSETPVSQPLKINSGGFLVYNGQPAKFVVKENYSMLVIHNDRQVLYEPNMAFVDPEYVFDVIGEPWSKGVISSKNQIYIYKYEHGRTVSVYDPIGGNAMGDEPDNNFYFTQPIIVNSINEARELTFKTGEFIINDYHGGWAVQNRKPSGGGKYRIDSTDTSSVDDGGGVIVLDSGARAKLIYDDKVLVDWFGASEDHDDSNSGLNVSAFTRCAKFCFDGKTQENSVPVMWFSAKTSGGYKVNASTPIPFGHIVMGCDGHARIRPIATGSKYTVFDNGSAITERCEIGKIIFQMWDDVLDPVNKSHGLCSAFRFYRLSRNAKFDIYCIGGDTGLDIASKADHWGIHLGEMCRFESMKYPIRADVNGQTFSINGGLFNSTVRAGTDITISSNIASQISINCVLENDAINTAHAGGRSLAITGNVQELYLNIQSERLGRLDGTTGSPSDYDIYLENVKRCVMKCSRPWGGGWGSKTPGNSRQYGMYLKNSHVTFEQSRLFSFNNFAINGEGDSSISCDAQSQIDGRIGKAITISSETDLGKNRFPCSNGSQWEESKGVPVPLGWRTLDATSSPVGRLIGNDAEHLTQGTVNSFGYTNTTIQSPIIKATKGNHVFFRAFGKFAALNLQLHKVVTKPDGSIQYRNTPGPNRDYEVTTIASYPLNNTGVVGKSSYVCYGFKIDVDCEYVIFTLSPPNTTEYIIEQPACYLVDTEFDRNAYSDNDGTYGLAMGFGPALPALENGEIKSFDINVKGKFTRGQQVQHEAEGSTSILSVVTSNNALVPVLSKLA